MVIHLHTLTQIHPHTYAHTYIPCTCTQNKKTQEVTDMLSFYHLPSTIVHHPVHKTLRVAYGFYNISFATPLKDLLMDSLILAKKVNLLLVLQKTCHNNIM